MDPVRLGLGDRLLKPSQMFSTVRILCSATKTILIGSEALFYRFTIILNLTLVSNVSKNAPFCDDFVSVGDGARCFDVLQGMEGRRARLD